MDFAVRHHIILKFVNYFLPSSDIALNWKWLDYLLLRWFTKRYNLFDSILIKQTFLSLCGNLYAYDLTIPKYRFFLSKWTKKWSIFDYNRFTTHFTVLSSTIINANTLTLNVRKVLSFESTTNFFLCVTKATTFKYIVESMCIYSRNRVDIILANYKRCWNKQ